MRIAVGALLFEGNTFSLAKADINNFYDNYYFEGQQLINGLKYSSVEVSGALSVFDAYGVEAVPLIATHGGCGGMVTRECFDALKEKMLAYLSEAGAVDGVYLALHGAMICEDTDNAEVELLREVRALIGSAPLVMSCDLHAHIVPEMLDLCDAIVGYQQYPHDDVYETGVRSAGILMKSVKQIIHPVVHMKKMALLITPTMSGTQLSIPMQKIYKKCRALEQLPGVYAVSYFPSTPWAERSNGGTAFVLTCERDFQAGDKLLTSLCEDLWADRDGFLPEVVTLEEALEKSEHIPHSPIILSEMSDAVGAGAAGDSAYVLAAYLASGRKEPLLVQVVDPETVKAAKKTGVGRKGGFAIGNKIENRYGPAVKIDAEVLAVKEINFTYSGGPLSGTSSTLGEAAVLRSGPCTILVTSRSAYEYADEQYQAAGVDVREFRFVIVKNPMNYRQAYAWAPATFALDTPGAGRADLTSLEWRVCRRPFYPLDDSPTALYR